MRRIYNFHCHLQEEAEEATALYSFCEHPCLGNLIDDWVEKTHTLLLATPIADADYSEIQQISIDVASEQLPSIKMSKNIVAGGRLKTIFSVGLHPWSVQAESLPCELEKVRAWASLPFVSSIGEVGLDKVCLVPMELQQKAFIEQIRIAEEYHKPMVIHMVRSTQELLSCCNETKKKIGTLPQMVIHGFRGKAPLAEQLIRSGFYLSFGWHYHPESLLVAFRHKRLLLESDTDKRPIALLYASVQKILKGHISP